MAGNKARGDRSALHRALSGMGYVNRGGAWLKPFGFQLLVFYEQRREWVNWFVDENGKAAIWQTESLKPDRAVLLQLKTWEASTRGDVNVAGRDPRLDLEAMRAVEEELNAPS